MHSLRSRFTVLTICVVMLAVASILFVRSNEHRKSDQLLLLLCETGEKNLNNYFNGVQKSVKKWRLMRSRIYTEWMTNSLYKAYCETAEAVDRSGYL